MNKDEVLQHLRDHDGEDIVQIDFLGETTLLVTKEKLVNILSFLKSLEAGFVVLMDLTGVDYLTPEAHTEVVYLLHNPSNFQRIRVKIKVKRDEPIPSVVELWGGADWYERELYDMFGIFFTGHPDLKRILMPDDWVGHPMRRDYPLTEVPVQFKHGVRPKVPSQIITYAKFLGK